MKIYCFGSITARKIKARWLVAILACFLQFSCTFLSNRNYVQQHPEYRGIRRVALFVQRWPVYLQLSKQDNPGADFIKESTLFTGPWQPSGLINDRAVDVQDIDDEVVANLFIQALTEKGYQPYVAGVFPSQPGPITVAEIMAKCQAMDRQVDALLFCFYSPAVFCAEAKVTPKEHQTRSYGLQELIGILNPGDNRVIWAGPRAAQAPPKAISHGFIYISTTMFRSKDWRPLWEVADSQTGGRLRVALMTCPPGPTDQNYWADAAIIQRLMCNNLRCRLEHLIPDAF
ncbi:MAG: hypothetical protein ACYDIC_01120 [Desulfobaccales bacterium]